MPGEDGRGPMFSLGNPQQQPPLFVWRGEGWPFSAWETPKSRQPPLFVCTSLAKTQHGQFFPIVVVHLAHKNRWNMVCNSLLQRPALAAKRGLFNALGMVLEVSRSPGVFRKLTIFFGTVHLLRVCKDDLEALTTETNVVHKSTSKHGILGCLQQMGTHAHTDLLEKFKNPNK